MRIHLFLLAALAWFASCGHSDIHQAIKQMAETAIDTTGFATRSVNTNRFSSVEIDCFADVDFIQTDGAAMPHVCIAAPPAVIDHVTARTADDHLVISTERRYRMPERAVVRIEIYAPYVSAFTLNGGKCLRLGRLKALSPLTLETYGVGSITAERIEAPEVDVRLSGDGNVDLKGMATGRLRAEVSGAGHTYLSGMAADTLFIAPSYIHILSYILYIILLPNHTPTPSQHIIHNTKQTLSCTFPSVCAASRQRR